MKKPFLLLAFGLAGLAACRETNTGQRSSPLLGSAAARTLRFDTTFVAGLPADRVYRHSAKADVPLGPKNRETLPVEVEWTTAQTGGCAQVVAVRVYQLGAPDPATRLLAQARRDATCRPGTPPTDRAAPVFSTANYTGLVLLKLSGVSATARTFGSTSLTLNGLGNNQ